MHLAPRRKESRQLRSQLSRGLYGAAHWVHAVRLHGTYAVPFRKMQIGAVQDTKVYRETWAGV